MYHREEWKEEKALRWVRMGGKVGEILYMVGCSDGSGQLWISLEHVSAGFPWRGRSKPPPGMDAATSAQLTALQGSIGLQTREKQRCPAEVSCFPISKATGELWYQRHCCPVEKTARQAEAEDRRQPQTQEPNHITVLSVSNSFCCRPSSCCSCQKAAWDSVQQLPIAGAGQGSAATGLEQRKHCRRARYHSCHTGTHCRHITMALRLLSNTPARQHTVSVGQDTATLRWKRGSAVQ